MSEHAHASVASTFTAPKPSQTPGPESTPTAPWWDTSVPSAKPAVDASELTSMFGIHPSDVGVDAAPSSRTAARREADARGDAVTNELERATRDTPPATDADHRSGLIDQIKAVPALLMDIITVGNGRGLRAIQPEHSPDSSLLSGLLATAAAMAVAGVAGTIAVHLGTKLVEGAQSRVKQKFVEDAIKEAVKSGLKPTSHSASISDPDLAEAFRQHMELKRASSMIDLHASFAHLHDALSTLPTTDLEALSHNLTARLQDSLKGMLLDKVADQTVLAWTNFLAQAKHGAMGHWDLWERNGSKGAVDLEDSTPRPTDEAGARAATVSNVDPRSPSVYSGSDEEHFGLLEIAVTTTGALLEQGGDDRVNFGHGYGMRLENVGAAVRGRIRKLGKVRDVPLNKVVRVYSVGSHSIGQSFTFLITADGYVRSHDLQLVRADDRPLSLKEQLGVEHRTPLVDQKRTEQRVADVAEHVQNLSLTELEG